MFTIRTGVFHPHFPATCDRTSNMSTKPDHWL